MKIPTYYSSYNEEENLIMHQFIENASAKELVEKIHVLIELYDDKELVENAKNQLVHEICERDKLQQQYNQLLSCRNEWEKYINDLLIYDQALYIRQEYKKYKEYKKRSGKSYSNGLVAEIFKAHSRDSTIQSQPTELIRRAIFSEESNNGIKKPAEPKVLYSSLEEIKVKELNTSESLEKLGKANLKYLLIMLLQFVDTVGSDNKADVMLTFIARKYSRRSHKETPALFTTTDLTLEELTNKNQEYLKDIKYYESVATITKASIMQTYNIEM